MKRLMLSLVIVLTLGVGLSTNTNGVMAKSQSEPDGFPGFVAFYDGEWWTGFAAHTYDGQGYPHLGWLDGKASSVVSLSSQYTCIFSEPYYGGDVAVIFPGKSIEKLSNYAGGWNNRISSIKMVRSGEPCR